MLKWTILVLALSATTASAQMTQFYGPDGQYRGQAQSFDGITQFYGPRGQYQGQAQSLDGMTTTYFGPRGQYQGQSFNDSLGNDNSLALPRLDR